MRPEPQERAGRGVRHLDTVPAVFGPGGPAPGPHQPPQRPQQHLLLGAVVPSLQKRLQGDGPGTRLPAAAAAHQLLLHQGQFKKELI